MDFFSLFNNISIFAALPFLLFFLHYFNPYKIASIAKIIVTAFSIALLKLICK